MRYDKKHTARRTRLLPNGLHVTAHIKVNRDCQDGCAAAARRAANATAAVAGWKLESMKNQCNSLRHALIDFDARKSLAIRRRARARATGSPAESAFVSSGATDGGNNPCAIITRHKGRPIKLEAIISVRRTRGPRDRYRPAVFE